jgi:hypothetical protein
LGLTGFFALALETAHFFAFALEKPDNKLGFVGLFAIPFPVFHFALALESTRDALSGPDSVYRR